MHFNEEWKVMEIMSGKSMKKDNFARISIFQFLIRPDPDQIPRGNIVQQQHEVNFKSYTHNMMLEQDRKQCLLDLKYCHFFIIPKFKL
jgi:hypothetical protein